MPTVRRALCQEAGPSVPRGDDRVAAPSHQVTPSPQPLRGNWTSPSCSLSLAPTAPTVSGPRPRPEDGTTTRRPAPSPLLPPAPPCPATGCPSMLDPRCQGPACPLQGYGRGLHTMASAPRTTLSGGPARRPPARWTQSGARLPPSPRGPQNLEQCLVQRAAPSGTRPAPAPQTTHHEPPGRPPGRGRGPGRPARSGGRGARGPAGLPAQAAPGVLRRLPLELRPGRGHPQPGRHGAGRREGALHDAPLRHHDQPLPLHPGHRQVHREPRGGAQHVLQHQQQAQAALPRHAGRPALVGQRQRAHLDHRPEAGAPKAGSFFFPGGNVTYQGTAVTLSRKEGILHNYKDEAEWRANVDTVMRWFTQDGLDLVTLYFGEPDSTGHKFGPESPQRKAMVQQVDRTVGYLRDSIRRSGLERSLNLIITSDHGMTTVHKKAGDLVEFHKFPNFTFKDIEFELLDYGPNGMLLPKEGQLEKVYEVLKDAHPKLHVYKKEDFPKSFHYANHPRITPLLMYSDPGYVIHGRVNVQFNNGEHGFDNTDLDMKTIFRAVGPSFQRGLEVEPFESVHVYELLCKLLRIVPEANDGDPRALLPMLTPEDEGGPSTPSTTTHSGSAPLAGGCPALMTGLLVAAVLLAKVA
ncbi:PREDICTED: ectonucleotide pyrophosphatase/phosphodiesterase family member 7 isoform X2 [Myotis davidii]|uniref:ectonucleotide pyrophosphatase/phosphodiesterase family member 7 isoform X2 n=1 Tax=Myotis davidii TaxID=225400 RepID=UPI000767C04B|nr:PREDICTED: ectonucleotide pyrophosphatase/phosphodiesterase family member 7 isoform X2 [Myotis davidii]